MAKAIKFKNDNYLDSTSIVHKKTMLDKILDKLLNRYVVLWSGNASMDATVTLNDNINNYEYLLIDIRTAYNYNSTWVISKDDYPDGKNRSFAVFSGSKDAFDLFYIGTGAVAVNNQLTIKQAITNTGTGYIERVVGIR